MTMKFFARSLPFSLLTFPLFALSLFAPKHPIYAASAIAPHPSDQSSLQIESLNNLEHFDTAPATHGLPPSLDKLNQLSPEQLQQLAEELDRVHLSEDEIALNISEIFNFLGYIPILNVGEARGGNIFRGVISHFLIRNLGGILVEEAPMVIHPENQYDTVSLLPGKDAFPPDLAIGQWYAGPMGWTDPENANEDDDATTTASSNERSPIAQGLSQALPDITGEVLERVLPDGTVSTIIQEVVPEVVSELVTSGNGDDDDEKEPEEINEGDPERVEMLQNAIASLADTANGTIQLPAGDYSIPLQPICIAAAGNRETYKFRYFLAPIQGKRADIVTTFNARAVQLPQRIAQGDIYDTLVFTLFPEAEDAIALDGSESSYDPERLQRLIRATNHSIQAGMPYDQFDSEVQILVDELIPEYRDRLNQGFLEKVEAAYTRFQESTGASVTLPDFYDVTNHLGPLGPVISGYRDFQDDVSLNQDIENETDATLIRLGDLPNPEEAGQTPWSEVSDRVYARLLSQGDCNQVGEGSELSLQVRILPDPNSPTALRPTRADVPITGLVGDAQDEEVYSILGVPILPVEE